MFSGQGRGTPDDVRDWRQNGLVTDRSSGGGLPGLAGSMLLRANFPVDEVNRMGGLGGEWLDSEKVGLFIPFLLFFLRLLPSLLLRLSYICYSWFLPPFHLFLSFFPIPASPYSPSPSLLPPTLRLRGRRRGVKTRSFHPRSSASRHCFPRSEDGKTFSSCHLEGVAAAMKGIR